MIFIFEFNDDVGLIIPNSLKFLPIILGVILILCYLIEYLITKPIKRLFFFIFSFILLVEMLNPIESLNMAICVLAFVYFIVLLVMLCRKRFSNNFLINEYEKTRVLPTNIFSKKHLYLTYILLIGVFVFTFLFLYIFNGVLELNFFISLIITSIVVMSLYVFLIMKVNPLSKALSKINRECDFNSFYSIVQELKNNNINQDSLEYLNCLEANYFLVIDKNRAYQIFSKITAPKLKEYLNFYEQLKVIIEINKENFENANLILEELKIKNPNLNIIYNKLSTTIKALSTNDEIKNIEKLYTINTKTMFTNMINAELLMHYYFKRHNIEKTKFYADFLYKNAQSLIEIKKEVELFYTKIDYNQI